MSLFVSMSIILKIFVSFCSVDIGIAPAADDDDERNDKYVFKSPDRSLLRSLIDCVRRCWFANAVTNIATDTNRRFIVVNVVNVDCDDCNAVDVQR